jgi:hypothetical protein
VASTVRVLIFLEVIWGIQTKVIWFEQRKDFWFFDFDEQALQSPAQVAVRLV